MYKILLLIAMIFLHIIDDYVLQAPCLSSLKQKSFWEQNAPDKLYKYDYIMALFMHSFSWAFMIMLIPTIYILIATVSNINTIIIMIIIFFIFNLCVHMFTDNLKANKKKINLIQDQSIHIAQIIATWVYFIVIINNII